MSEPSSPPPSQPPPPPPAADSVAADSVAADSVAAVSAAAPRVANKKNMALHFSACQFTPQPGSSALVSVVGSGGTALSYKTSSFYLDSAGRVQVSLPLQLEFESKQALEEVLQLNCIAPAPPATVTVGVTPTVAGTTTENDTMPAVPRTRASDSTTPVVSFSLEARVTMTYGTGEAISATVEGVTIDSTRILMDKENNNNNNSNAARLGLWATASLRVSRQDNNALTSVPGVKLNLEVVAVWTEKRPAVVLPVVEGKGGGNGDESASSSSSIQMMLSDRALESQALASGLRDLYSGRCSSHQKQQQQQQIEMLQQHHNNNNNNNKHHHPSVSTSTLTNARFVVTKTKLCPPILCQVSLTHALAVQARSMYGPTPGETWIALTIHHSNTHGLPVTITNVILHPAFSKTAAMVLKPGGAVHPQLPPQSVVVDMSQHVSWKFLTGGTAATTTTTGQQQQPAFPKVIRPNEAYSTILYVTAEENILSRSFTSPISVTATLGSHDDHDNDKDHDNTNNTTKNNTMELVSVVQAHWTSGKRAISPSNAFRVEFTVPDQVTVGQVFSLLLSIQNLGTQRHDLKVVVVNNNNNNNQRNEINYFTNGQKQQKESDSAVQTAPPPPSADAISFFHQDMMTLVFGGRAAGEEQQQYHHHHHHHHHHVAAKNISSQSLLPVDDSYCLGTIHGQQTVDAELRFIPLQTGTLTLPHLELAWMGTPSSTTTATPTAAVYKCPHNLQVVATAAAAS